VFFEGCARIGEGDMACLLALRFRFGGSERCDDPRSCFGRMSRESDPSRGGWPERAGDRKLWEGSQQWESRESVSRVRRESEPELETMRILSGWGAKFPERSRSQTVEGVRNPEGGSRPAARGGGGSSTSPSGLVAGSVPGVRKQGETYESESSREAVQNAVPEALPATEGRTDRGLEADRRRVEEDAKSMRGAPLSWSHTTEASISCSPEGQPATVKVERGAVNSNSRMRDVPMEATSRGVERSPSLKDRRIFVDAPPIRESRENA